jgi:hypothetical protein
MALKASSTSLVIVFHSANFNAFAKSSAAFLACLDSTPYYFNAFL